VSDTKQLALERSILSCIMKGAPTSGASIDLFDDPMHREVFEVAAWIERQSQQPSPALLTAALHDLKGRGSDVFSVLSRIDKETEDAAGFADFVIQARAAIAERFKGWPDLVSARDLVSNPPPTPPVLIDGVLYRGGTMLMAGPSKAAKTWTLIDAALAIATGGQWMGFATIAVPVLYLNLELPAHVACRRLKMICHRRGIEAPAALTMWNLRGKTTTLIDLQRMLPSMIRKHGFGAVFVDPHYKVSATSGYEENSNDDQGKLLAELEAICSGNDAAVIIAHHFAKGDASGKNAIDRASGGGVFARWPDAFMALTPHEEDQAMTLDFVLRAFPPVAPRVVRWSCPIWVQDETLDPARLKKAGRTDNHPADRLLSVLKDGMSNIEWRKATGWPDATFRRKRDELTQAGKVRLASGCYYRAEAA